MKARTVFLAAAIVLMACTASAANYYVDSSNSQASDSNPGTEALPWLTIQHAADTANPGDTIIVKPGSYGRTVIRRSGSPGLPIAFKGAAIPNKAHINFGELFNPKSPKAFPGNPSLNAVTKGFDIVPAYGDPNPVSYISLENFEITAIGPNDQRAIRLSKTAHIEILNNLIHETNPSKAGNANGIYGEESVSNSSITVKNNTLFRVQGIGMNIKGDNWLVEGNEISHGLNVRTDTAERLGVDVDAIRFFGTGHIIRNNFIHSYLKEEQKTCGETYDLACDPHIDCFQTFTVYPEEGQYAYDILIEKNYCDNIGHQMFMVADQAEFSGKGNQLHHITLRNNVFRKAGAIAINIKENDGGLDYFTFANNVVAESKYSGLSIGAGSHHFTVLNNIFYNNGKGPHVYETAKPGSVFNYNIHYPDYSWPPKQPEYDINGMFGIDPKFVNAQAGNFHLQQDSPAIDKGTTISDFSEDKDGIPRPQGPRWDIGAYEFQSGGPTCTDADLDGYGTAGSSGCTYSGTDCNDADSSIHPNAAEKCGDGKDNDCSGGDAACSTCLQGAVPSTGCTCGGTNYYSGYCCSGVYSASSCSGLDYFAFEAENGVLAGAMSAVNDSTASGEKYIRTTTTDSGTADYSFTASGGEYVVWALSKAGTPTPGAHNSFYVLMDGTGEDVWDMFFEQDQNLPTIWTWGQVSARCGGTYNNNLCNPRKFNLSAGQHTLRFRGRETDTRTDKLVITNDLAYNPEQTQCPIGQILCNNACITPSCSSNANCNDNNALTTDTCSQPGTCNSSCSNIPCTISCSSNAQCNDSNPLTNDICLNAGTCSASCSNTAYQNCGELIAANCNCEGNIYSTGLCCNNSYRAQANCSSDAACNDQNTQTNDYCLNSGTCSAYCSNTPIQEPICSDGQTTACITEDSCTGTRTCTNNAWGSCEKTDPECPQTQDLDADGDGLLATRDCNDKDASIGLCTGCAVCSGGKCVGGNCPSTLCPESECRGEDYYEYPSSIANSCAIQQGLGTCSSKECTPIVSTKDSKCTIPPISETIPLQVLAAAITLVAIGVIAIAWVLKK